jgi:16S rRNA (guanine966-N2)-methyltransferase
MILYHKLPHSATGCFRPFDPRDMGSYTVAGGTAAKMRVIAGVAKGIHLQAVPGTTTRPISDRVKEAVFDILGESVIGAHVLDLFAGTGSVGIEALSRGATEVVFVDSEPRATLTIRANLRAARLEGRGQVVRSDVFRYLSGAPRPFDLVYVAPPQYAGLWRKTLLALDTCPLWHGPDGEVIIQVFPKEFEPVQLQILQLTSQRKYGSTLLCFFRRPAFPDPGGDDGTARSAFPQRKAGV